MLFSRVGVSKNKYNLIANKVNSTTTRFTQEIESATRQRNAILIKAAQVKARSD